MIDQPRLLSHFTPVRGVMKADVTDFVVEELPLYSADGAGTHTYFFIEKTGLSTMHAVNDIAHALQVQRREIGYAGLKDARAVTRQWMSVEHVDPERVAALEIPRIRILEVTRHRNKLKLGHLRGNQFDIKLRHTETQRLAELQDALRLLCERGVPNYFGQQRFGGRGDAWQVGRAVLQGDLARALELVLGVPGEHDHGDILRARELYEAGQYRQAARKWPGMFRDERRALETLARTKNKNRAFLAIDHALRRFYISAYQSYLFNQVVAARLPGGLGTLLAGDLALLHANGAVFRVEDPAAEQTRATAFEISPTGPLFGYRMTPAEGAAGEIEQSVLDIAQLTPQAFRENRLRVKGARRPLRFPVTNAAIRLGADAVGAYFELTFQLPRGCYATAVLRELFSDPADADGADDSD